MNQCYVGTWMIDEQRWNDRNGDTGDLDAMESGYKGHGGEENEGELTFQKNSPEVLQSTV